MENSELQKHLEAEYPKQSKIWVLARVAFLNDYHRGFVNNLCLELRKHDSDAMMKFFGAKLCDSAMYSAWDWLNMVDPKIKALRKDYEGTKLLWKHFEVEELEGASDKVTDLVHGEGYSKDLRDRLTKGVKP